MTTFDGGLTFIPGTNVFGDSGRGVAVDVVRKIWIAVGWGHPWAAISNNGIHFNAVNSSNLATGDAITYSRSRQLWLAVGSDNNANSLVATSPNGLDWTTRSVIGKSYTAACNIELCLIGGMRKKEKEKQNCRMRFIIIVIIIWFGTRLGTNNYGNHSSSIMYSTDAFTWNPANTQNALITIVFGVAYSSSQRLWVVVGNFDDFSPTIATSTDGKTFNGIASTKGLFSSAYSVAFSQSLGLWVAGGVGSTVNNTALAWSKDGNSWTAVQTDGIIEEVLGVASMVDELAE